MNTITTSDGAQIYFKGWSRGQPIIFSHSWQLNSDSWESQMFFLESNDFRCIAHVALRRRVLLSSLLSRM